MDRRRFLSLAAGATVLAARPRAGQAAAPPGDGFERIELTLEGDPLVARRALLLVPKHAAAAPPLRLVVLLHGLAETASESLGVEAWSTRYGVVDATRRLVEGTVDTGLQSRYLPPTRADAIERELRRAPFHPFVLACPYTPNPRRARGRDTVRLYADWIEQTLLPAVRTRAPVAADARATAIGGCSLGGFLALEVFLERPALFAAMAGVQSALGEASEDRYATGLERVADRVGPRKLLFETSSEDPYRSANESLAAELGRRGVAHDLLLTQGPHTQPWLREVGSLEMLFWLDRALPAAQG